MVFPCQLTAESPVFCTLAVNGTVAPAKGCAELGVTVTITGGGGAEEDTRPPQEFEAIARSKGRTSRNESLERNTRGGTASRGWRIKRTPPRVRPIRKCRSSCWDMDSVRLSGIRERRGSYHSVRYASRKYGMHNDKQASFRSRRRRTATCP